MERERHTYVPAFDGLRAVAIVPVVLLHVAVTSLPNGPLMSQLARGWYGVDLFFVLSGFLITWILLAEIDASGTIDLKRFYGRRFLRLAPAYVTTLIGVLVGALLLNRSQLGTVPRVAPTLLTYTYNYQIALGGPHVNVLVIVWSLCVEEQFYLVWPWMLRRLGTRRGLWFCILAVFGLALYRSGLYAWMNWGHLAHASGESASRIYFSTDTRVGVIFVGCMLALSLKNSGARRFWDWARESKIYPPLAVATACATIFFITGGSPSSASWRAATFGYTLGAITVAMVVAAVFTQPGSIVARALSWEPLVVIGRASYGTYLFHLAIVWVVLHALKPDLWTMVASRMSDPALGAALPVSQATVVPFSGAMGWLSAAMESRPDMRFAIVALLVLVISLSIASLHYQHVEKRFLSLRKRVPGRADLPGR